MLQDTFLILSVPHDNRLPSSLTQTRLVDLEWSCRRNGEVQNDEKPFITISPMEMFCESDRDKLAAQASTLSSCTRVPGRVSFSHGRALCRKVAHCVIASKHRRSCFTQTRGIQFWTWYRKLHREALQDHIKACFEGIVAILPVLQKEDS